MGRCLYVNDFTASGELAYTLCNRIIYKYIRTPIHTREVRGFNTIQWVNEGVW